MTAREQITEILQTLDTEEDKVSETLFTVYPDEMYEICNLVNNKMKLIAALDEYVNLLGEELNEVVPLAHVHGWKTQRFEKGKEMREKIDKLRVLATNNKDK